MAIDAKDFNYVYNNYNEIINNYSTKKNRTSREDKLYSEALLMEKLVYDSRYEE